MGTRTFAKPFVTLANGRVIRKLPGDTIDSALAADLGLGEHLFDDADDPRQDALDELSKHGNRNDFTPKTQPASRPGLAAMSVVQLREYARDNGITLGEAARKTEILAAIDAEETRRAESSNAAAEADALQAEAAARQAKAEADAAAAQAAAEAAAAQ